MSGFVSLLDDIHYVIVEDLWKELEDQFGLNGIRVTPYPHFSWQVAEDYNLDRIEKLMQDMSKELKPFKIRTSGLGIFTGESPILFIAITKNKVLLNIHEMIFNNFKGIANGLVEYYAPSFWVPHVSLAYADLTQEKIGDVMKYLAFRDFHWEISIDNISFIYEPTGTIGKLEYKITFGE